MHLRECNLTQLSTSEVFTGCEYQGEYLDKTIAQLHDREVSARAQAVDSQLGLFRKSTERRHAHPATRDKFTSTGLGWLVEVKETSKEIHHLGGCPLQGQAEDHQQPFGFLLSFDGSTDFRLVRESSALRSWCAKDVAVALDWPGRTARSPDRVGGSRRRHGGVAPRETREAPRQLPGNSFNRTTSTTISGSGGC